jgi:mRNA-degrading endonuclease RelE of RelBE toxin-antitoxin system
MRFEFKPSFDRSVKSFRGKEKEEIKQTAIKTIDILSGQKYSSKGIGLKHLRTNFWEARSGIKVRILFRWDKDLVEFILAGDHNDIRRYLKDI